jgi:hypothetical protein
VLKIRFTGYQKLEGKENRPVTIIPGNINSGQATEKSISLHNLPTMGTIEVAWRIARESDSG